MAQDNVGKHAQSTPPSFIPAGSRRRTTPAVTPAAQSSGTTKLHTAIPQARRARTHNIVHITFVHE